MKTSKMSLLKNGLGLAVLLLLATAATIKAETYGDYTYTINANGTVRIDQYTGSGTALTILSTIEGRTVVGIGHYAFSVCTTLTSVTIPDSVLYIEEYAFNECSGLAGVTIGTGVTSIGFRVFNYCSNLATITVDALNSYYGSLDGVLFNKNQTTLVQYPAGKSGGYTIPGSVTNIGYEAFSSCTNLTGIAISNSVTSIGESAFWGCSGLTSITLPDSVINIGQSAFNNCTGLTSLTLGSGVTSIGESAFFECTGLTGVTIPASVTDIGVWAFGKCTSLTAITVDALNSYYGSLDGVLFNKNQTTLVQYPAGKSGGYTIPDSVTSIGDTAFAWCINLTSITIPESVTSIGEYEFLYCTGLTGVTIPNSVTSIGYYTFENCTNLTSVTIGTGITSIVYWAFNGCTSLTGVTIPDSVTSIGGGAFGGCTSLIGVTIPNSVTSIGVDAFNRCSSLTSVTVGTGVSRIEDFAFASCSNLTGVYFWGNAPNLGADDVFDGDNNATIYYLPVTTGWGTTFGGRPTALWNPLPLPIVKANGASGTVTVNYPDQISVTVELNAGNYAGTEVDWWVVAFTGSDWLYLNSSRQWTPFDGNLSNCHPVYQGGLFNLPALEVLNITGVQTGYYTFWFAIDYPMDGILDLNGTILLDSVNVTVH